MIKRLWWAFLPFTLVCMLFFAACGGNSPTTDTNTPKTITIWHNWQGAYLTAKQAIFSDYHKQHPNITIKLVQQTNLVDKAITAVKANNGPDIIAWADDSLGQLAASRVVVPMDQYIDSSYLNSTFTKQAAQALTYNGKVYGVPETVEAVTLMYNKKLVSESELPKTTEDLLNFAKTYQKKHPGQYGIAWNTTDAYFNAPWFYGFGAYYVDSTGKVGLNTDKGRAAAEYINSFRPYLPKQISYDVASSLFTEGKSAMIINGPWAYADYKKANIDIGFATLPTVTANSGTPAMPFVGVKSLWVTKNAKDLAVCADIMKFYSNTQNQTTMIKSTGEIPANSAALSDTAVTSDPVISNYAAQVKLGTPLPNTPYMSALWKPVADALTAIWSGSQSPADALSAAQGAADKGVEGINS